MMLFKKKESVKDLLIGLVLLIVSLIIIFPLIYAFFSSFKTDIEFVNPSLLPKSFKNLDNYFTAISRSNIIHYTINSFIIAFFGSALRLIVSIITSYVISFYDFRYKKIFFIFVLLSMMMPPDILLSANYITIIRLNLLNTYVSCIIVSLVSASQIFILRQVFNSFPYQLYSSSIVDGANDFVFLFRILLPNNKTVLKILFAQGFISFWNAYIWPLIVTSSNDVMRTMTIAITKLNSWEDENFQLVLSAVLISIIPVVIFFIVLKMNLKRNSLDGAVKG